MSAADERLQAMAVHPMASLTPPLPPPAGRALTAATRTSTTTSSSEVVDTRTSSGRGASMSANVSSAGVVSPTATSTAATMRTGIHTDSVPNLLRQYEESLTLAISPRAGGSGRRSVFGSFGGSNATNSEATAAAVAAASPRAVFHSPNAFAATPPELPTFSPKRRSFHATADAATVLSTAHAVDSELTLAFPDDADDDESKSDTPLPPVATDGSDTPRKSLVATKTLEETTADIDMDDSSSCLICMDEFSARRKAYPLPCTGHCTGAFVHYRCIMAWLGQSGSCPLCRGVCDPLVLQPLQKLELVHMPTMALQPVPLDAGIIRCYVKQVYRGLFKQYGYELYLQGQIGTQEADRFLLAARRQVRSNMTANYVICTDKECSESNRIGRMGSNFLGTCFTLYDNGRDPQKIAKIQDASSTSATSHASSSSSTAATATGATATGATGFTTTTDERNVLQIREELGCVTYEPNRTSVGPRKMRVVIPAVDENGLLSKIVRPMSRNDRLVTRLATSQLTDLMKFSNREPVFREDLGAYCLDFGGRVSMASVKNFQLIHTEDPSMGNVLQFGRVADDMFTMDFQWPLSPFQAFATCLSSCDTKLACV